MKIVSLVYSIGLVMLISGAFACSPSMKTSNKQAEVMRLEINKSGSGNSFDLSLTPGASHNHPSFAIWAETMDEKYIQTLFVTKSVGTGYFGHGSLDKEKWDNKAGVQSRPASLPYWLHKRLPSDVPFYLPTPDQPVADAYTGATPQAGAILSITSDQPLPKKFKLFMEVNQPWDWNSFWTNSKYDDPDYRTSSQPSLIYAVTVDLNGSQKILTLNPIGHGHYSGKTGELFTDISTLTTAKEIFSSIQVTIK